MLSFALALAGLGVSTFLTIEHYSTTKHFACPQNAVLNCVKVTTSEWSEIHGVPVALLGLFFYVVMAALTLPIALTEPLHRVRLAVAATGPIMVVWLVYVELFKVNAICLWCTAVHIITVAMFATILWHFELARHEQNQESVDAA